jgi:hypothetical protein
MSNWKNLTSKLLDGCMKAFGTTATYAQSGEDEFDVVGVFDRTFEKVNLGQNEALDSEVISFGCKILDLDVTPKIGDELTIEDEEFQIREIQKDGQGHVKFLLSEVP